MNLPAINPFSTRETVKRDFKNYNRIQYATLELCNFSTIHSHGSILGSFESQEPQFSFSRPENCRLCVRRIPAGGSASYNRRATISSSPPGTKGCRNSFFFHPTDKEEISKIINNIDQSKSTGPNSIPNRILSCVTDKTALILSKIFNISIRKGKFIEDLKLVKVYLKIRDPPLKLEIIDLYHFILTLTRSLKNWFTNV